MIKRIFILAFSLLLLSCSLTAQLTAWGDTTICEGGQAQLYASGEGASYYWTAYPPDNSLLVPQTQNPIVSPDTTTMYVVQSNIATGNLILNGSFELGNMGFSSEYTYNPQTIVAEGTYAVVTDANTVHPNFFCDEDHTSGNGKFMAVNGATTPNEKVWYLSLPNIQPDTKYEFSTWITSLHATNPAILQFSINGVLMGQPFQAYSSTCDWYQFFHIWDSETNETALISIVNQNTVPSGNDFALDDISFATVLVYYDTVYVEVLPQLTSNFVLPNTSCDEQIVEVFYTGNGSVTSMYNWDFDGAQVISGTGPGPYQLLWDSPGSHSVSLWVDEEGSCSSDTTFHQITIYERPGALVTADETYVPFGESTILHGAISGNPGPLSFSWFPPDSLIDPLSLDPETKGLEFTTTFILTVTDQSSGCQSTDSITIIVTGGPLLVDIEADPTGICLGESTQLFAEGSGGTGNYSYTWTSNPPGFNSDEQYPVVFPEVTTIFSVSVYDSLSYTSASVTVTVYPQMIANAGEDTLIDYGTVATLHGTTNTGANEVLFYWEPDSLLENPASINPTTIALTQNARFIFWIGDPVTGCESGRDTVFVFIEGGLLNVQIFANPDTICKGEIVELTGSVSGGYPPGYSFTWKDSGGNIISNDPVIELTPVYNSTYFLEVSDGFTVVEDQHTVVVNPLPNFSINEGTAMIFACPFDSVTLQAIPSNEDWNYYWSNGSTKSKIVVGTTGIGFDVKEYTLFVSTDEGCYQERSVTVIFDFGYCIGIEETDPQEVFSVFPNPADKQISLTIKIHVSKARLDILDLMGRMMYYEDIEFSKGDLSYHSVDISNLAAGTYQLRLITDNRVYCNKIVIY